MIEPIKSQPVTPRDRAKSLFFNLKNKYGYGTPYDQKLRNELYPCRIQRIKIDGVKKSIGIIDEENHLIKLFFFNTELPYMDNPEEDPIVCQIDAGKLCPASQRHFYNDIIVIRWKKDTHFFPTLSLTEITVALGPYTRAEPSLSDAYQELKLSYEPFYREKRSEVFY